MLRPTRRACACALERAHRLLPRVAGEHDPADRPGKYPPRRAAATAAWRAPAVTWAHARTPHAPHPAGAAAPAARRATERRDHPAPRAATRRPGHTCFWQVFA